jgi:uncharacterized protein
LRVCTAAPTPYLVGMPYQPPPELSTLSLSQIADLVAARKLPPVDQWTPDINGDSEMRIAADGRWFHQGGEIKRAAMVRAFSSLLRHDDGQNFLVTPHEKLSIIIDDAAFIAVELRSEGEGKIRQLALRLNTDDLLILDAFHPIEMRPNAEQLLPYALVRKGLWAKLSRPVYYEMAEIALSENPDNPGFWSAGQYFQFGAMA